MSSKAYNREVEKARRETMKQHGGRMPTAAEVEAEMAAISERHAKACEAQRCPICGSRNCQAPNCGER